MTFFQRPSVICDIRLWSLPRRSVGVNFNGGPPKMSAGNVVASLAFTNESAVRFGPAARAAMAKLSMTA